MGRTILAHYLRPSKGLKGSKVSKNSWHSSKSLMSIIPVPRLVLVAGASR